MTDMKVFVYNGILFLLAVLGLAALITQILYRKNPTKELAQVKLRIKTWLYIITIFSLVFLLPKIYFILLLFVICLISLKEIWFTFYLSKTGKKTIFPFILSLLLILSLISAYQIFIYNSSALFLIVVLAQLNDVFQYLWGKSIGKHHIVSKISPNKTWEGFLGGIITSALLSCFIAQYYLGINFLQALFLGGIISCLGFLGDITVSLFKRQCNVKDLGTVLPGHGGLMDRIDSLIYVFPVILFMLKYI